MNTTTKPVFLAAIFIAIALTFSCSSDNGKDSDADSSSSNGDSSSSAEPSSSSVAPSSSSSSLDSYSFMDTRDNQIYKWVKIGDQIWMAENLNYNAEGSQCFDNDASNCATYGRLYDWTRAMTINGSGVCPLGWHIPSDEEWDTLTIAVGGTISGNRRIGAGTALKATSGWIAGGSWDLIPGTDDFGFSALPGGHGETGGATPGFYAAGYYGGWWTSTNNFSYSAWRWSMGSNGDFAQRSSSYTGGVLHSVRCVKD
ncbi:MAG: fibrobacter succinogenes major paralogous domain-containing protein [Fibromonadaceae bacterium]|jgi:uncharacterized protein (TIGR02145 family)|nr:fibrobacter succinogenes major paralogous domain-containing protein [Fibromonadaceae bacterium]